MHPIYEFMVGDTVSNIFESDETFQVSRGRKFFITERRQLYMRGRRDGPTPVNRTHKEDWQNHYRGLIENLSGHFFDEDELCTCRMIIVEKIMV